MTRLVRLLLAVSLLGACGAEQDEPGSAPEPESSECAGDFDAYEAGMTRQAEPGDVTVELLESEPAPPAVRKDNTWRLRLSDAEGEPLMEAELHVTPWMPAHQHGTAEVVVEELGDGEYRLSPIDLIMPGVWEVPVAITTSEGDQSAMTYRFCIAEL
jgi:hypothetical protein